MTYTSPVSSLYTLRRCLEITYTIAFLSGGRIYAGVVVIKRILSNKTRLDKYNKHPDTD